MKNQIHSTPIVNKSGQISVGEGRGGESCAFPSSIIDCLEDSNALMATHGGDMDICMFCWSHEASPPSLGKDKEQHNTFSNTAPCGVGHTPSGTGQNGCIFACCKL